jgi:hypothetical protein
MRALLAALLALCPPALAAAPASPAPADLAVTDKAPQPIHDLFVSPTRSDDWGIDRLGDATIAPGHTARVKLGDLHDCTADIRVVYGNASAEERHEIDLCHTRQISFDGTGASQPAGGGPAQHAMTVQNGSLRPIQQVLIAAEQAGDWGDNLLAGSLSAGDRATVTWHGDCLSDLRVVFDNGSAEERRALDLCGLHGIDVQPGWTTAERLSPLVVQKAGP